MHHILFLDADELAQIQEISWMHQHAICMVRGFDYTMEKDPDWCSSSSYPKSVDLRDLGMPGDWGIIDVKRHAAIKGGGKMQKRMLAMLFLFSQAVKSNRISDLPRWWTQTGYVGKLLTHFVKTSKIRSGRSRGRSRSPRPVLLVAAARNKREKEDKEVKKDEEYEEEEEDEDEAEEEMNEASRSPSERRVRTKKKKQSKKSEVQNAELERLKKELAQARAAEAKATAEKEVAILAARVAQDAEEEAQREKEDAIQAAQAAAVAEEKARHDLETLAKDTAKVMEAVGFLASDTVGKISNDLPGTFIRTKMEVKTEECEDWTEET